MSDHDATNGRSSLRDALGFPGLDPEDQRRRVDRRRSSRADDGSTLSRANRTSSSGQGRVAAVQPRGEDDLVDLVSELCTRVAGLEATLNDAVAGLAVRVADEAVTRANSDVIARVRDELIGFSERLADALGQARPSFGADLESAWLFEEIEPAQIPPTPPARGSDDPPTAPR